jgi:glycine cleavage system H protein
MQIPSERSYSKEHEWALQSGDGVKVGITDYAQDALGDVVFVELPHHGATVKAGEKIGEVESTKSVSEIYSPIDGSIIATNERLTQAPELLNQDPYGDGWICEIAPVSSEWNQSLLDADGYRSLTDA